MRIIAGTILAALATLPTASTGQQQEDRGAAPTSGGGGVSVIIYRDAFFSGPAVAVEAARPDIGLAWEARSIRVRGGEWQLCTGRNFTGRCTTIDRDTPNLGSQFRAMQSIRPTGGWGTGVGQSLRGSTAEFFTTPMRNGQRIQCQGGQSNSSCARQAANQFCRSVGWILSRSQAMDTVSGRAYLADVLCARSAF